MSTVRSPRTSSFSLHISLFGRPFGCWSLPWPKALVIGGWRRSKGKRIKLVRKEKKKSRRTDHLIFLVLLLSMRMILSSKRTRRRERKTAAASRPITPAAKERKNESSETSQSRTIKTHRIASVFGPEHFLFHRVPTVGEQNHPGDAEGEWFRRDSRCERGRWRCMIGRSRRFHPDGDGPFNVVFGIIF